MTESDFAFLKYHDKLSKLVKMIIDDIKDNLFVVYTFSLESGTISPDIVNRNVKTKLSNK